VASFRFTADSDTVTAVPYPPPRRELIETTFHHSVLPLALQALGREGVHASAVLTPQGVVGFCGKSHTGKSTLAYAMSRRGYALWSDDALVWEKEGHDVRAVGLPFEPKLRPPALAFFGYGSPEEIRALGVKSASGTAPLRALCVLTRTTPQAGEPIAAVKRLSGGDALTTLLDHAHCFNPYDARRKRQMMVSYLTLLDRVPVFDVRFEASFTRIFEVVEAISTSVIER
jgi:hypothetical protein